MFKIQGRRGSALKKLRERHGVSQAALAERLGIGTDYLSRHETEHGGFGLPRGFGRAYQEALLELLEGRTE